MAHLLYWHFVIGHSLYAKWSLIKLYIIYLPWLFLPQNWVGRVDSVGLHVLPFLVYLQHDEIWKSEKSPVFDVLVNFLVFVNKSYVCGHSYFQKKALQY